ncbi:MAG: hypothetical protein ACLSHW_05555 [Lachnospiraceae bacterium]
MKQRKITKRQAALMLLEMCHGYLILFAIYACVVVISGHGSEPFVLVGCLLFPLNAGLFLAEKKATHFWQFGIVTLLLIGGSVMLAGSGVCGIWTGILGVIAAFSYFYARASETSMLVENIPSYPWLGIALVLYFLRSAFCVRIRRFGLAPVLAALYYLICNFHINLEEVDSFLKTHASLERLPVRRLARINQGMMWMVSGLTAGAMIAAPYLGIDQLIRQAWSGVEGGDPLAAASDSEFTGGRGNGGNRTGSADDAGGCEWRGTVVVAAVVQIAGSDRLDDRYQSGACVYFVECGRCIGYICDSMKRPKKMVIRLNGYCRLRLRRRRKI